MSSYLFVSACPFVCLVGWLVSELMSIYFVVAGRQMLVTVVEVRPSPLATVVNSST